ncbi:hypothetical protein [Flavobacterium sp. ABG]|uniref:hypothetical protein n=1 Tax=Flavobacterium sp. ABG TaxID=1423322 RepID=UPI00064B00BC|nr:hypothetical protein [Flavobacterium sp. ABG]KLT69725.1 hypothetical protein AB674_10725 [Flavobacterium sp. ABG]
MVEKNYDPDNDHCPEKDTVENLHKSKLNNGNTQTVEEFINDHPNFSKNKEKESGQKKDTDRTRD